MGFGISYSNIVSGIPLHRHLRNELAISGTTNLDLHHR